MDGITRDAGSFRDPNGQVHLIDGRVFRTVQNRAKEQIEFLHREALIAEAVAAGFLVDTWELQSEAWPDALVCAAHVFEHRKVPYVSYPYEWGFAALRSAALHHLDFQLWLLERDAALSDASAYNIQFVGGNPVFIDMLSIIPYEDGAYWAGYRQFCEQFLNPLLLRALKGVAHNAWYRGTQEGISSEDLAALLSLRDRMSPNVMTHVVMHAKLQRQARQQQGAAIERARTGRVLSRRAYWGLLTGLRNWIARLSPAGHSDSTWGHYADDNSYSDSEGAQKAEVIATFCQKVKPGMLFDLGCNSGAYSQIALKNGAKMAVGFDFDQTAVDKGFHRAKVEDLSFLPLWLDAANTSPNQGWQQQERLGFLERAQAGAVIALAFEHHLVIGKNLPLQEVIAWLTSLAPRGLIEFVPKDDPTVEIMLALREDIFESYCEANFRDVLSRFARITGQTKVSASGRIIFEFERQET